MLGEKDGGEERMYQAACLIVLLYIYGLV
jgi:hypothetical protein